MAGNTPTKGKIKVSPRAKRFAADYLVDLSRIPGSGGLDGRITEDDVRRYLDVIGYFSRKITPTALNLARQEKLDMFDLTGSGEGGRITLSDVQDVASERPLEMSSMRKTIAQRLVLSKQTIPHFYVTVGVEMDMIMALRRRLRDEGVNYSLNVFILKAAAMALRSFPLVNAVTDGRSIRRRSKVNIGMAVSVDNGLLVPVIRNADCKALDEIHAEAAELAEKARMGRIAPDEMRDGTFTVSNMGMMKVESFGAIINSGEGAILAVGSVIPSPVVCDGMIVVREMMKITMSADHRLIDGSMAAAFVNQVKDNLECADFWNCFI